MNTRLHFIGICTLSIFAHINSLSQSVDPPYIKIPGVQEDLESYNIPIESTSSSGFDYQIKNINPPPVPDFNILTNSITHSVNYPTGTATVNIPLHNVNIVNVSIPIGLSYMATGHKVQDVAPWTGLGWNLTGIGRITRILRGAGPDEDTQYAYGYRTSSASRNGEWSEVEFRHFFVEYEKYYGKPFDMEPDIFQFDLGHRSGYFFFDDYYNAHLMPKQDDLSIRWNRVDNIMYITDGLGSEYTYRGLTTTRVESDRIMEYISEWNLTSIKNIFGDEINIMYSLSRETFEYYTHKYEERIIDRCKNYCEQLYERGKFTEAKDYHHNNGPTTSKGDMITDTTRYTIVKRNVKDIQWNGGRIIFYPTSGRIDVRGGQSLSKIRIYGNDDTLVSGYDFEYSNFSPSNHLRLDGINLISSLGNMKSIAKFSYNLLPNLPARDDRTMYESDGYTKLIAYDKPGILAGVLNKVLRGDGSSIEFEFDTSTKSILKIKTITENHTNNSYVTTYEYFKDSYYRYLSNKSTSEIVKRQYYTVLGYSIRPTNKYNPLDEHKSSESIVYPYNSFNDVRDLHGIGWMAEEVKETLPNGSFIIRKFTGFESDPDLRYEGYVPTKDGSLKIDKTDTPSPHTSMAHRRGLLLEESYFEKDSDSPIRKIKYNYIYKPHTTEIKGQVPYRSLVWDMGVHDRVSVYKLISEDIKLLYQTVEGPYDINTIINYEYKDDLLKKASTSVLGYRPPTVTEYTYGIHLETNPSGYQWTPYRIIKDTGLRLPIQTITSTLEKYGPGSQYNSILNSEVYTYKIIKNIIPVLHEVYQLEIATPPLRSVPVPYLDSSNELVFDSKYKRILTHETYDNGGRVLSSRTEGGQVFSQIYGYKNSLVIADVVNAMHLIKNTIVPIKHNEVFHTSFEDHDDGYLVGSDKTKTGNRVYRGIFRINTVHFKPNIYKLTYWESTDNGVTWQKVTEDVDITYNTTWVTIGRNENAWIDEVRILPKNSRITTYTYDSANRKTTETDHNGKTTYMEYDDFGRLTRILNNERQTLTAYKYNDPLY